MDTRIMFSGLHPPTPLPTRIRVPENFESSSASCGLSGPNSPRQLILIRLSHRKIIRRPFYK